MFNKFKTKKLEVYNASIRLTILSLIEDYDDLTDQFTDILLEDDFYDEVLQSQKEAIISNLISVTEIHLDNTEKLIKKIFKADKLSQELAQSLNNSSNNLYDELYNSLNISSPIIVMSLAKLLYKKFNNLIKKDFNDLSLDDINLLLNNKELAKWLEK